MAPAPAPFSNAEGLCRVGKSSLFSPLNVWHPFRIGARRQTTSLAASRKLQTCIDLMLPFVGLSIVAQKSVRQMASNTALGRYLFDRFFDAIELLLNCREPERHGLLASVVNSNHFGALCMMARALGPCPIACRSKEVILLNAILISYMLAAHMASDARSEVGSRDAGPGSGNTFATDDATLPELDFHC